MFSIDYVGKKPSCCRQNLAAVALASFLLFDAIEGW